MGNDEKSQENALRENVNKKTKAANKPDIFNGPIIPTTIKLLLPVILMQVSTIVYFYVDTFYISLINRQSTALISAVGLIFPIYTIFYAISVGMWTGISSLVARGIGAKNENVIERAADSGLFLCGIIGLLALLSGLVFGSRLIQLFAGSRLTEETIKYANDFFYSWLPGLIILLFVYFLNGMLSGEGLTKYIAIGWAAANLTNIILAPFFIFLLKMGIKGAGAASSISMGILFIYFSFVFFQGKTTVKIHLDIFKASLKLVKEIFRIGAPACLVILSFTVAVISLNKLVGSISQAAMNSWVLVGRIDQIILIPAISLAGVTTAMIGQNYGRGIFQRVERIFYTHLLLVICACTVLATIYVTFSSSIFRMFSSIPEVIAGSVRQVYFTAFTYPALAGMSVIQFSFQATGRAFPGLIIVIIRLLIITIPLSLLSVYIFKTGMTGIFISIIIATGISYLIAFLWGRSHIRGLYKNKPVILS